jgi:hypothetical protein
VESYNFVPDTGGPTDPGLTPCVGSGFATVVLGDVQSASEAIPQYNYPRQKSLGFFAQDTYRATPKLTLIAGLRWDFNFRGHEQAGRWHNFDITAQNPLWGSYRGAWVFESNSGQSFYTNEDYHQFAPRVGGAYQLKPSLVLRASYGLFYVPINTLNSGFGSSFPANQNSLSFPISQVLNTVPGSVAFDWDNGYPAQPVLYPQNSTDTSMGSNNEPLYIHPGFSGPAYAAIAPFPQVAAYRDQVITYGDPGVQRSERVQLAGGGVQGAGRARIIC